MEWGEAIIDGIHRSRVIVLVFSASANEDFYHHAYTFSRSGSHYARLSLHSYRTEYVKIIVCSTAEDENTDVKLDLRPLSLTRGESSFSFQPFTTRASGLSRSRAERPAKWPDIKI